MTRRIITASAAALVAAVFSMSAPAAQQPIPPTLDAIVTRAGEYIHEFVQQFANVVAEERYVQQITYPPLPAMPAAVGARGAPLPSGQRSAERRELKSDFLLVRTSERADYLSFRDVFEVDGRAVRDREQRLSKLFLEAAPGAVDQATRVAFEGSRYNLSGEGNTINNPLVALTFLQERFRERFRFTLGKLDKDVGPTTWIVNFEDRSHPTLIRASHDTDIVARGRYWIDADTGRVLKSELTVGTARFLTLFRFDETFKIAVPFAMQEWGQAKGGTLTGNATYGRFRTFQVSSEEKLQQ